MTKVIVTGAAGHMGKIVERLVEEAPDMEVAARVSPSGNDGTLQHLEDYTGDADLVIDFSHHAGTKELMDYCTAHKLPAVVATTGQTDEEKEMIRKAAEQIPVFYSANMSVGVAFLTKIVKLAAQVFPDADVEIVEAHHNRKLDAPSGTALMLADAVKEVRPDAEYHCGRSGHCKREKNEIGISSIRMGNVVGEHEVFFNTGSQTIKLQHSAHDRALFAEGALDAARFLLKQQTGLYGMDDLMAD
ncbi:MAG: 4-hydroxy-tetrahydrodipicolinate reductase [Eubacterium sp.]